MARLADAIPCEKSFGFRDGSYDFAGTICQRGNLCRQKPSVRTIGKVMSLHVHPRTSGAAMIELQSLTLIAGKGVEENPRYFGRVNRAGRQSRRQLTLIEREQIRAHADSLGIAEIFPGSVRANIETEGISLMEWLGCDLRIGTAVVRLYEPRTPCARMDAVAKGLRRLMENSRQGVLAEIIQSGRVTVGDGIQLATSEAGEVEAL